MNESSAFGIWWLVSRGSVLETFDDRLENRFNKKTEQIPLEFPHSFATPIMSDDNSYRRIEFYYRYVIVIKGAYPANGKLVQRRPFG